MLNTLAFIHYKYLRLYPLLRHTLLLVFLLGSLSAAGQCLLVELPLDQRISEASYIVEGKITGKRCFWDQGYKNIYTAHQIELYKVFKGELLPTKTIEIITRGGRVDTEIQIDQPSLQLRIGDVGLFLLKKSTVSIGKSELLADIYLESTQINQSFFKYDFNSGAIYGAFHRYQDIEQELYAPIQAHTQRAVQNRQAFDFNKSVAAFELAVGKIISSFDPSTITAGTGSVLTINGSNFGNTQGNGNVEFTNANISNGNTRNVAALPLQVLSWSNNQITVEVPSNAGTGRFEVITNGGTVFTSSNNLTIPYANLNIAINNDGIFTYLINANSAGGYTWSAFTDFFNGTDLTGALDAIIRAQETHCANSGVNWILRDPTTVDVVANDGVNVIRFDNGAELPSGTLGRLTNYYSTCNNVYLWTSGKDMVFNDGFNWNAGPGGPAGNQYDLESVALHEFGHAHQLGHTLNGSANTGDIMFPSIGINSNQRSLATNDANGAMIVFGRSSTFATCGESVMTASANCMILPVELITFDGTAMQDYNVLTWQTATEINNVGFEIQRSSDTKTWKTLGFVKGAGTSIEQQTYAYHDHAPQIGLNYYRLKQMDSDDTYEYSEVIAITNDKISATKALMVYPNPATTELILDWEQTELSDFDFEIVNSLGVSIAHFADLVGTRMKLSVSHLPSGHYTLLAKGEGRVFTQRFIKE
ncbi:MAG: IPT/TIG domain-containing protein [Bacteroidota bacterium]